MAPAITSETASCSRAPCLLARDHTASLLSVALVDLGETDVNMNSQTTPNSQNGSDVKSADAMGTVPFHPFASLPSGRSAVSSESPLPTDSGAQQEDCTVYGACPVNGVGVSPSQSLNLANACRVSLKSVPQRTVSIVIKNNGACGAGIVSNSVHGPVLQTLVTSGNCNGGSQGANVVVPTVRLATGTQDRLVAHPVTSLHRMLITPRKPNHYATAGLSSDTPSTSTTANCVDVATNCDTVGGVHSDVEQLQVVHSESQAEHAADVTGHVPVVAQTEEMSVDDVVARQCSLVSRADRTLLRLRRLQSREANSSVRRQLAGLVATLRRSVSQLATLNDMSTVRSTPDLKSMSTLELVGFVRQMQSSEASSALAQPARSCAVQLSVCPDMADTAERLSSNLRHLESAVDSDATESSSGGETDNEEEQSPATSDEYVVISDS